MIKRTKEFFDELWRLDTTIWKHFYPNDKKTYERPKDTALEIWLQEDIAHILREDNIDDFKAEEWIRELINSSPMAKSILEHCISIDKAAADANIRRDFYSALKKVKHGSELSWKLGYGLSKRDLKELAKLHKSNKCRRKIEELLTDCNFHSEVGLLSNKQYECFFEKGEIA